MDATFLTTLRQRFPRVTLNPPGGDRVPLGAVVDVAIRERAIVVTLEQGVELRFHADALSWRILDALARGGSVLRRSRARATPPH